MESVIAERTMRPRSELELVCTGCEGGMTLSRDTNQVLLQVFARAERRVTVAGFAVYILCGAMTTSAWSCRCASNTGPVEETPPAHPGPRRRERPQPAPALARAA